MNENPIFSLYAMVVASMKLKDLFAPPLRQGTTTNFTKFLAHRERRAVRRAGTAQPLRFVA